MATDEKDRVNKDEPGIVEQALRIARRRKWVILQATIVVPILALVFSLSQTKEYTATATLLFRSSPATATESTSITDPSREAATNGELVGLPVVSERAAERLHGSVSAEVIQGSVEVSPAGEAETASIAATTPDPDLSAKIANAYGYAYISFRRNADRAQVQNAIELAETSLAELPIEQREGAEGEALSKQLDQLRLTQALQTGGAELVQPASAPSSPSSPETKRNVGLGLILGILLGCLVALLLERIDRRVRSADELEQLYRLPVLARIPRSRKLRDREGDLGARTQEGEAFRLLRTNLRYLSANRDLRSILAVSPEEGDGKSTVINGLATTMAEMGDRVVLVEADLRKGGQVRQVDGSPPPGLSNVLAGASLDSVLFQKQVGQQEVNAREMTILGSGPPPPNPAELLESPRMGEVLGELQDRFDVVLLDSPALGAVSDALALFPLVSGIVVVAGLGRTTRDAAQDLERQFTMLNRAPLGVIINFASPSRAKYSHYYRSDTPQRTTART
jgi:capsular exopolysaccharide synthesis family protein